MNRITQEDLIVLVDKINKLTNSPPLAYSSDVTDFGKPVACVGHYHLSYAYGGVKLERFVSEGGGVEAVSPHGYGTKRELYQWMTAFVAGLQFKH